MVHCRAVLPSGGACNAGLWRIVDSDLIEVSHALRNGHYFKVVMPLVAAQQTLWPCTRCGTRWWPAAVDRPRLMSTEQAALAVVAHRPTEEVAAIMAHNDASHHGEAA